MKEAEVDLVLNEEKEAVGSSRHSEIIKSYRDSINHHVLSLCAIAHTESDCAARLTDINWCIDQVILLEKEAR